MSTTSDPSPRKTRWRDRMFAQVVIAIIAGAIIGYLYPSVGIALKPLGDAFIKLVKMLIGPVIFLTVVTGIAGVRDLGKVGGVVAKALAYFMLMSTFALVLGLIVANVVRPGAGMHIDPASLDAGSIRDYAAKARDQSVVGFLLEIIPSTVVSAFAKGDVLQVLFFSIPFGIALAMVGEAARPLLDVLDAATRAFFKLVALFMRAAPIGAFGAFAFTIGKYGLGSIASLAALVATLYATSILFVVVALGVVARLNGFSILKLLGYLKEEIVLVLGTSSSEAALPSLMAKLERAGAPASIVGLVVPTGYSFNLDGTNIYMTLAALFIAQALGIHLSLAQQFLLLGVAMVSSKGAAGVTGAGFITLAATLSVVPSVPVAGMALILGADRFMSQCRALTNFVGNAVATLVVARWEGALDADLLRSALRAPAAASLEHTDADANRVLACSGIQQSTKGKR